MGVAVDGAFWYTHSSKDKHHIRKILFIAMITTVAAVSIALFSQIKAQRSLALVMIIGIVLDWLMTRYVLEDIYLENSSDLSLLDNSELLEEVSLDELATKVNRLIKSDEKEILEDLIIAAINDAKQKGENAAQEEMKSLTGGLPLPPGMKLPF